MKKIDRLIELLATRMAFDFDNRPMGDDYNLLWDAINDECEAIRPGALRASVTWRSELMPHYQVELQIFLAAGDELEIEAANETAAERIAKTHVEERFNAGNYDQAISISEICVSSIYLLTPSKEPSALQVITPVEHALRLLDQIQNEMDAGTMNQHDVYNTVGVAIATLKRELPVEKE